MEGEGLLSRRCRAHPVGCQAPLEGDKQTSARLSAVRPPVMKDTSALEKAEEVEEEVEGRQRAMRRDKHSL